MSYQEEWDHFITRLKATHDPEAFVDELSRLRKTNPIARRELERMGAAHGDTAPEYGDAILMPFQASTSTHGASTEDDFFKAKSHEYLRTAEKHHAQDELSRSNEEGWAISDTDIL